jgi:hypothetical protein
MYVWVYVRTNSCVQNPNVSHNGLKQLTGQLTTRTSLLHRLIARRVLFYIELTQTNNPTAALQLPQRLACRIVLPNLPEAPFPFRHSEATQMTTGAGWLVIICCC